MSTIPQNLSFINNTPLATGWATSQQSFPEDPLPFLHPDAIAQNATLASLPLKAVTFLQQAARRIASNPDLTRLAWHAHRILFVDRCLGRGDTHNWPLLAPLLGNDGGAFYLLTILSGIPQIRAFHRSRNVPDTIAHLTYRDTYVWAKQYHDIGVLKDGRFFHPGISGAWGLCTRILPWLLSHLYGDLYRVGRLQYKTGPFRQHLRAYRHRETGAIRLLAQTGLQFRADGCLNGAGGIEDLGGGWTAELQAHADSITGTPIHPSGHALCEAITLSPKTWEPVLVQGDPILEIHIPEDGPMTFDTCGHSHRQAAALFSTCFPDRPFKAICCTSWFLCPTYQALLAPESNIVRFQRECYLFPLASRGGRSGLERIFGPYAHDLTTAPRNTSMRRAVLDHFASGGVLVSGGALLFTEHLKKWGTQFYLNSFTS